MKIRKRRAGTYRIDLTRDELTQLSEALRKHGTGHATADRDISKTRARMWATAMSLATQFEGVHTVKEET